MNKSRIKAVIGGKLKNKQLAGGGLLDAVSKLIQKNRAVKAVANVVVNVGSTISKVLVRNGYNNQSKRTIKDYGNMRLIKLWIYKKPVDTYVESFLNLVSLGAYAEAKRKANYDKLFHLGIFGMVGNEKGQFFNVIMEKNEVLHIEKSNFGMNGQINNMSIILPPDERTTMIEFLDRGQQSMQNGYFLYDAFGTDVTKPGNCQTWVRGVLEANGLYNSNVNAFVYQPLDEMLKTITPTTEAIAKGITNLGAVFNRIIGAGRPPVEQTQLAEIKYKKMLEDRKNDPKNDAYYNRQKYGQSIAKDNSEFLNMSASEKARKLRTMKKSQDDYKQQVDERLAREQAEYDAEQLRKEKASDPFSFMTDLVEEAVGSIPVVGKFVQPLVGALRSKLEGGGKPKKVKSVRKPSERNNIVRKIMNEKGISMIQASKYVKLNGLY
jgi:hypothetical protein